MLFRSIERGLVRRIIDEVKENGAFELLISREDACFIENNDPDFVNHIVNVMKNTTQIVDDVRNVQGQIVKLAVCNRKDGSHIVERYLHSLREKFGSEIQVVTSGNIWIDFIAPGTNKGTALLKLLEELRIRPEECMAFGDQYNDVEMLQAVGISYSMANSAPGISKYSAYVTDSVEDVLEKVLDSPEED